MKLNTKRTVLVGFAFLSICAFWQMYDNLIPKILTETFHMGESVSGIIMAADNILALFLLPLFGGLSDKCTSRLGRRRPYILFGTLAAVAVMMALPILTDSFHASPDAWKQVCFIIGLGILLTAMGAYRSPAVALMPDVTPKPLRSKANAVINLMGSAGGILVLALGMEHGRQATAAQTAVTDMTNQLLKKNAEMLKTGTIAVAKESERSIVDIETLQHTNEQLISTLDEVLSIQREGAQKRKAAEAELGKIEGELKQKLMELHG